MSIIQKLHELLESDQRRDGLWLIVLMLVGVFFEMLGLGLVVPVLSLITDPVSVIHFPGLAYVAGVMEVTSAAQLIVVVMLGLIGIYALKSSFLAYLSWRQARFVFSVEARLSRSLFSGYLHQPYASHLQANSALMTRNVLPAVSQFSGAIVSANMLASEVCVLMGMACLLVYTEPVGALLVGGALAVAGYSFHIITKRSILRWGESRHHHEGLRYKLVQEGLGGVRDVKILGREMEFIAKYDQHNKANADVGRRQNLVSALPRLWLEFLAVVGLSALVFLIIYEGKKPETMIPTLGLFATAAFRLMPSANKVLVAVQNLRYCLPVVNTLYAEKQTIALSEDGEEQSSDALIFEKTLVFDHVSYAYQETDSNVLSDLSFCIKKGSCVGFIGASGAGKSTLINVLLGLLTPTKGRVLVDEVDIQSNVRGWQNLVGYVPQSVFLMDDTLRNNIAFGLRDKEIDESAISRAVEAAQLSSFVASLPDGLSTNVGERGVRLSGGQSQRIGIARALYHDPPVLVLDEASSALDTETEAAFMAAVNCLRNDKTIVMVTHRLSTVSQCDELYEVAGGSVIKLSRIDSTDVV